MANDLNELWRKREELVSKALHYEAVDRIPMLFSGPAWAARAQGVPLSRFCTDPELSCSTTLDAMDSLPGQDGINLCAGGLSTVNLTNQWLSKVNVPGIDLPEDVLWQVQESETMTVEDYDLILNQGWEALLEQVGRKVHNPDLKQRHEEWLRLNGPGLAGRYHARGYVVLAGMVASIPFEALCGARSMEKFFFDCYRKPDKVKAALDIGQPYMVNAALRASRFLGAKGVWVGGWRAASALVSPRIWDKLVFPYYHDLISKLHSAGIRCVLHFDQNWDRDIRRFLEFPKGCVFSPDGGTNIRRAKEILGDHMAFLGDVPPVLLATGTPDDVYAYTRGLIRDLGPTGLVMTAGCNIPYEAPRANVEAMAAATGAA